MIHITCTFHIRPIHESFGCPRTIAWSVWVRPYSKETLQRYHCSAVMKAVLLIEFSLISLSTPRWMRLLLWWGEGSCLCLDIQDDGGNPPADASVRVRFVVRVLPYIENVRFSFVVLFMFKAALKDPCPFFTLCTTVILQRGGGFGSLEF